MNYFQWFIKKGWSSYAIPFILGAVITSAMAIDYKEVFYNPLIISILMWVSILGFDIGIIIYSVYNYRANK